MNPPSGPATGPGPFPVDPRSGIPGEKEGQSPDFYFPTKIALCYSSTSAYGSQGYNLLLLPRNNSVSSLPIIYWMLPLPLTGAGRSAAFSSEFP